MKLVYCQVNGGNFGDDLNPLLWREIFPRFETEQSDQCAIYGIGTILSSKHSSFRHKIVLGSGYTGKILDLRRDHKWKFAWVRGPLTAERLCLHKDLALTDPSILWSGLRQRCVDKHWEVGFVPHHKTMSHFAWEEIAARTGVHLIDPRQAPTEVAAEIAQCERLISESLHGAIFADGLRVPFLPIILAHRFNIFKWRDWLLSMGLQREFFQVKHCLWDRDASIWTRSKAVFWNGAVHAGLADTYRALRPRWQSGEREIDSVCEYLKALSQRDSMFQLSAHGAIDDRREQMTKRCREVASQFGLTYNKNCQYS